MTHIVWKKSQRVSQSLPLFFGEDLSGKEADLIITQHHLVALVRWRKSIRSLWDQLQQLWWEHWRCLLLLWRTSWGVWQTKFKFNAGCGVGRGTESAYFSGEHICKAKTTSFPLPIWCSCFCRLGEITRDWVIFCFYFKLVKLLIAGIGYWFGL